MNMSPRYSLYLGIALAWTILFSMSSTPGIRGFRNLGWLSCYVILIVMLIRLPFAVALTTWAAFGVGGGLLYSVYELISRSRTPSDTERPSVSFSHIPYGLLAWPIMIPEAIEYAAADLGLLPKPSPPETPPTQPTDTPETD